MLLADPTVHPLPSGQWRRHQDDADRKHLDRADRDRGDRRAPGHVAFLPRLVIYLIDTLPDCLPVVNGRRWSTNKGVQGQYLGLAPQANLLNLKSADEQG